MRGPEDYARFTASDFLEDDYFLVWLQGQDNETNLWWEQWQSQNIVKKATIAQARKQYELLISFKKMEVTALDENEVWLGIQKQINNYENKTFKLWSYLKFGAAAAVAALCLTFLFYDYNTQGQEITYTAKNYSKVITLEDGSTITLKKGAVLKRFSKLNRQVWLEGQGYFEVNKVKSTSKGFLPFIVHADKMNIRVTGTSFLVTNTFNAKNVILAEGRVVLSAQKDSVVMRPGDKIDLKNNHLLQSRVKPELYSAWKEQEFNFENTPLSELKIIVQTIYNKQLIIKDGSRLQNKTLNGVIHTADLNNFMKTISILLEANVRATADEIIIEPE